MKKCILLNLIFLTTYSFAQPQQPPIKQGINIDSIFKAKQAEAIDKSFPSFTTYYKGKVFTNKNLLGKVIFINFWYASCAPCIAELNELNKLYYSLNSNRNFDFISFTFESPKIIRQITKKYKIKYKIFSLKSDDCDRLNRNSGFPTCIIIDQSGTIKFFRIGGSPDKAEVNKIVFTEYYPKILSEL